MSRKKRGLRSYVLVLLSRGPKTGAELIDDMERMSSGWWRPSPGSIYPLLEELTQEGVTRRRDDGRYELVESVHSGAHFRFPSTGPRTAEDAVAEMGALVAYLEDLARSNPAGIASARPGIQATVERLTKLAK